MSTTLLSMFMRSTAMVAFVAVEEDASVREANSVFAHLVGLPEGKLVGRSITEFLSEGDASQVLGWLQEDTWPEGRVRLNFVAASGDPVTLVCLTGKDEGRYLCIGEPDVPGDRLAAEELMRLNNELATMARERARRQRELERTRARLEAALEEIETSYWHLKKIQEVLPVCMRCGKVKGDEVEWQSVAEYLKTNEIFVSHGYCPSCTDIVMRAEGLEEET